MSFGNVYNDITAIIEYEVFLVGISFFVCRSPN